MDEGKTGQSSGDEIAVVFTREELERLLHDVNNKACTYLKDGAFGAMAPTPWDSICEKLLRAIRGGAS